jgi:hypothetical protein
MRQSILSEYLADLGDARRRMKILPLDQMAPQRNGATRAPGVIQVNALDEDDLLYAFALIEDGVR